MTRLQQMRRDLKDEAYMPEMPPLDAGAHVLGYLWEVGPAAVTHREIESWQRNTGIVLASWQARFIRALSEEYAVAALRAQDPAAKAPWQPDSPAQRVITAAGLKNSIRGMADL